MARAHIRMPGRRAQGFRALGSQRSERRLGAIVLLYLLLIGGIVGYNAHEMGRQRGVALVVNVAARQRALSERYVKDVIFNTEDIQADPEDDEAQLLTNADALLRGGDVAAVQGTDGTVHIAPVTDRRVVVKLEAENRLIDKLVASGDELLRMTPDNPGFAAQLLHVRVVGAQVASISNDAVGQLTADTEAAYSRLVRVGIALGILGAFVAVAMGLSLRRIEARRNARFRSLVHSASDLITVVDADGRVRYQSPSAKKLLGIEPATILGTAYLSLVATEDRSHLASLLAGLTLTAGGSATAEYRVEVVGGPTRYVESIVSNLLHDRSVEGLVLNTRDVTDRKKLEDELAHQAFHDSLTGLPNRAVFRDRLDQALARSNRHERPIAVLLLDLDGFKTVNDSLGHDIGDDLLIAVGARIQGCARASDTVARLGGDEFVVLLSDDVDETTAMLVADRILSTFTVPFQVADREVFISASVGIAVNDIGAHDADALIRNADTAMYAAKTAGRSRYEVFRPVMHDRAVERFEVQADLRRALERDEFLVYYQPIVDVVSGAVQGTEALIRWMHPTRGLLQPGDFIPAAEETGLIVPMGAWVLAEACRQNVEWRAGCPEAADLWVSVNLSTRQLFERNLVAEVQEILGRSGLDPAALVLEITEGSLLQGVTETVAKLGHLKELGVRLAIDDFGTGSSSLGNLKQFPVDILKIDKSFVDDVATTGSEGPALVRAIIELAHTLRIDTVAEGIEEPAQLAELRSAGCQLGQGYLFARPLPADAIIPFLQRAEAAPSDAVA